MKLLELIEHIAGIPYSALLVITEKYKNIIVAACEKQTFHEIFKTRCFLSPLFRHRFLCPLTQSLSVYLRGTDNVHLTLVQVESGCGTWVLNTWCLCSDFFFVLSAFNIILTFNHLISPPPHTLLDRCGQYERFVCVVLTLLNINVENARETTWPFPPSTSRTFYQHTTTVTPKNTWSLITEELYILIYAKSRRLRMCIVRLPKS